GALPLATRRLDADSRLGKPVLTREVERSRTTHIICLQRRTGTVGRDRRQERIVLVPRSHAEPGADACVGSELPREISRGDHATPVAHRWSRPPAYAGVACGFLDLGD